MQNCGLSCSVPLPLQLINLDIWSAGIEAIEPTFALPNVNVTYYPPKKKGLKWSSYQGAYGWIYKWCMNTQLLNHYVLLSCSNAVPLRVACFNTSMMHRLRRCDSLSHDRILWSTGGLVILGETAQHFPRWRAKVGSEETTCLTHAKQISTQIHSLCFCWAFCHNAS